MLRQAICLALCVFLFSTGNALAELVLYFDFEELDGKSVKDQSPSVEPHHGLLQGDAAVVLEEGGHGKRASHVLRLDGDGDYLDCGSLQKLTKIKDHFTIALWFRGSHVNWGQTLIGKGYEWSIGPDGPRGGGPIYLRVFSRGRDGYVAGEDEFKWNPGDELWHHLAATYDRREGELRLYVDGHLDKSYPAEQTQHKSLNWSNAPLYVGAVLAKEGKGRFHKGAIDDVRFYDHVLSGDEIRSFIDPEEFWIDEDPLVRSTLPLYPGERSRLMLLEQKELLKVRPVALPEGKHLVERNRHLGWPVACKVGKTILVAHHRILHHHGGRSENQQSSHAVVIRSTDGGETWSAPLELRQFGVSKKPLVISHMLAIGSHKKTAYLATIYGLYRSDDEGQSWELMEGSLTNEQTGSPYRGGVGPQIFNYPSGKLSILTGVEREPYLDMYESDDQGEHWKHRRLALKNPQVHPLEPTGMIFDEKMILVSRNHALPFRWQGGLQDVLSHPVMMVSGTNDVVFKQQGVTNISSYRWPDTTDLIFNPVTQRFEAVVTNRNGGVLSKERDEGQQTVNLWSIAKEDLLSGRTDAWQFECTLIRFGGGMRDIGQHNVDAAHPAGSIVDRESGVQHIFIYCGRFHPPAGIYRITRTLETDALRKMAKREE